MLILAFVTGALAVLGLLTGLDVVGGPVGSHALDSDGWALFVNGAALMALSIIERRQRPPPA